MKKTISSAFASLIRKAAVSSVSETSDWYTYQAEEPKEVKELYLKSSKAKINK